MNGTNHNPSCPTRTDGVDLSDPALLRLEPLPAAAGDAPGKPPGFAPAASFVATAERTVVAEAGTLEAILAAVAGRSCDTAVWRGGRLVCVLTADGRAVGFGP